MCKNTRQRDEFQGKNSVINKGNDAGQFLHFLDHSGTASQQHLLPRNPTAQPDNTNLHMHDDGELDFGNP
jgi:hypothetical protein